jgi:serine/threonine protein kinase
MSIYERTPLSEIDQNFKHIACLKYGRFSKVFLAKNNSGRYVTLKFFDLTVRMMCVDAVDFDNKDRRNNTGRVEAQQEIDVLQRLKGTLHLTKNDADHENEDDKRKQCVGGISIVPIEHYFHGPDYVCIVMKYVNGGTLEQDIRAKNVAQTVRPCQDDAQPYTERRIASYALQLCAALDHIHRHGIAHRNVESSNVLIDRTNGGKLMLADFGCATSSFFTVQSYL